MGGRDAIYDTDLLSAQQSRCEYSMLPTKQGVLHKMCAGFFKPGYSLVQPLSICYLEQVVSFMHNEVRCAVGATANIRAHATTTPRADRRMDVCLSVLALCGGPLVALDAYHVYVCVCVCA